MRHYPPRTPRQGGHWSTGRNRLAQARFRQAVLANAGHQCQWIGDTDRCPITSPLQAHHTQAGNDDPATGLALCTAHHKALDPHAR